MKKKLFAIIAVAAMTLSLAACGDSEKKTTEEKTTAEATEDTASGQDVHSSVELDGAEITPDETPGPSISATRGTIENGVFTNDTFKVSFPVTDSMTVLSDAEALDIIGADSSILEADGTYTVEKIEQATGSVYDSIIYLSEGGSNVILFYASVVALGGSYTAKEYAELTGAQFASTYTVDPVTEVTYAGQTYSVLNMKSNQGFSQKMLMRIENGYMVCITLTILDGEEALADDFLNSLQ